MNRISINVHQPIWVDVHGFATLPFRTPQLQQAIIRGLTQGFPDEVIKL